jgi:hypothetical protein
MADLDLELAIVLEGTAMVARTTTRRTGRFLEVSADTQSDYLRHWQDARAGHGDAPR